MLLDVATGRFSYGYNDWGLYELQNPQRGLGGTCSTRLTRRCGPAR